MQFKTAVRNTPDVATAWRPGLRALRRQDRDRIQVRAPRSLRGSVNVDEALEASQPNAPRWDYGVGLPAGGGRDRVAWIEVHPASSAHVKDVLDKHAWLKTWLRTRAPRLRRLPPEFIWLASGKVFLQGNSPQRHMLAAAGIVFCGRSLRI